tara:strand:- start:497 stop:637 length:141 start_codon:yes stop_codon:yes gene_type:complete
MLEIIKFNINKYFMAAILFIQYWLLVNLTSGKSLCEPICSEVQIEQ